MKLSNRLDPQAITLCSLAIRQAINASHLASMPEAEKQGVIAIGVEKMMAAGAFVRNGTLFFPLGITADEI